MQEVLRRWAEYGPRAVISWLCRRKRHMAIFAMRLHRKKVSENWQKRRLSLIFSLFCFATGPAGQLGIVPVKTPKRRMYLGFQGFSLLQKWRMAVYSITHRGRIGLMSKMSGPR